MQAAQITLKQYGHGRAATAPGRLTAQLPNWLTRVFGCWHTELSRPFTHDNESYRTCLECGARRNFDPQRWEMVGRFYYASPKGHKTARAGGGRGGDAVSSALKPRVMVSLASNATSKA